MESVFSKMSISLSKQERCVGVQCIPLLSQRCPRAREISIFLNNEGKGGKKNKGWIRRRKKKVVGVAEAGSYLGSRMGIIFLDCILN